MRFAWLLALMVFILSACAAPTVTTAPTRIMRTATPEGVPPPAPTRPIITFQPDTSTYIPNPERGFFEGFGLEETSLDWYAQQGYTLAYTEAGDLHEYVNRDLPAEYLERLDVHFELARQAGIKLIVRFFYNSGESYPNPDPDASLEQVLRHIEQLAPTLEANKDVIAWFEAGFIGAWGEWHTSSSGLDTPENKLIIRDALLQNFPDDRFILFRYPADIVAWYPKPLSTMTAFGYSARTLGSSPQVRVGHHNDCFLASEDDMGTYYDFDGSRKIEEFQSYIAQISRFTPLSGETCALNPPRTDCGYALLELRNLHWTALNEAWHPEVIQGWKDQGCYEEIRNHLGYRLFLLKAQYEPTVQAGKNLTLFVDIHNSGFAPPMLPRAVYLVLAGEHRVEKFLFSADDPRRWEPGTGSHTIGMTTPLPADLPPGEYTLALWLPDPSETLRDDPRYAIRFANEGVWDAEHGWNVIGSLTVTK